MSAALEYLRAMWLAAEGEAARAEVLAADVRRQAEAARAEYQRALRDGRDDVLVIGGQLWRVRVDASRRRRQRTLEVLR